MHIRKYRGCKRWGGRKGISREGVLWSRVYGVKRGYGREKGDRDKLSLLLEV